MLMMIMATCLTRSHGEIGKLALCHPPSRHRLLPCCPAALLPRCLAAAAARVDYGFRTAPLIRLVSQEPSSLLAMSQDAPRMYLNIEDYLYYNQLGAGSWPGSEGMADAERPRRLSSWGRGGEECSELGYHRLWGPLLSSPTAANNQSRPQPHQTHNAVLCCALPCRAVVQGPPREPEVP